MGPHLDSATPKRGDLEASLPVSELGDASHRQTHPMSAGKGRPQRASESDEKGGADRWDKAAEGVMGLGCIGLLSTLLLSPAPPLPRGKSASVIFITVGPLLEIEPLMG